MGLSEETDAVVIVVSEETGIVSVMRGGKIERDVGADALKGYLYEAIEPGKNKPAVRMFGLGGAR